MILLALMLATAPATEAGAKPSKKEAYLAAKRDARPLRRRKPRRGTRAEQVVFAKNLRTNEIMPLTGPGVDAPAHDRFFRCWFTGEHRDVPDELVGAVLDAAEHFDVREIRVISGFRHPKYNLMLRKKGREVARNSQHTRASAIDFFLPRVSTRALYRYLLDRHPGGVGYYPVSQFVHVDTGKKRTWRGS